MFDAYNQILPQSQLNGHGIMDDIGYTHTSQERTNKLSSQEFLYLNIDCRFMGPLTTGDYPKTMHSRVGKRLPKFNVLEAKLVNNSFDFIGINYYTAFYAANAPQLRNARPNYVTDSLANLTSEEA